MSRLDQLEQKVRELYEAKDPGRADWADWLYVNHVFVVTDKARQLATKLNARVELAAAAAMLHDIADATMSRFAPEHTSESLRLSRELMEQFGFSQAEIGIVVDDAIRLHSCLDGQAPASVEGKILATADALAHIQTDFYVYAAWVQGRENKTLDEVKGYVRKKIGRDFNDKILFDDVKEEARPDYDAIVRLYSH